MNEAEINAKISGWFEPKPEPVGYIWTSQKLYWRTFLNNDATAYEWHPLDYFHSEEASARLLEAMPFSYLKKRFRDNWWEASASQDHQICNDHDRKTAIVLAFLKFAGLEAQ